MNRRDAVFILVGVLAMTVLWYQINPLWIVNRVLPLDSDISANVSTRTVAGLPRIPRHIHMTWKTSMMPHWSYHKVWQKMNPNYTFSLWTDDTIVSFLTKHHPRFSQHLNTLSNIEKADLIRYAVLYTYGGIYADIDAKLLKKIDDWAKVYPLPNTTTALIGIEAFLKDNRERLLVSFARVHQYCQWTMMSAPRHPLMLTVLDLIHDVLLGNRKVFLRNSTWRVLETTGPGIFSDGVEKFLNSSDSEQYPTIIVPQVAFAVGGYPMLSNIPTELSLVKHDFRSSWK